MPTIYDAYSATSEVSEATAFFLDLLACFAAEADNEKWLNNRYSIAKMATDHSARLRKLQRDLDKMTILEG